MVSSLVPELCSCSLLLQGGAAKALERKQKDAAQAKTTLSFLFSGVSPLCMAISVLGCCSWRCRWPSPQVKSDTGRNLFLHMSGKNDVMNQSLES